MRLVTWNCQGAFRRKAAAIAPFRPDVAVIQECEPLEKLSFPSGAILPTAQLWFGDQGSKASHKGVGVFSYTGARLAFSARHDDSLRHCAPIRVHLPNQIRFNLIAVWAMPHTQRRLSYIGQVYQALTSYRRFMRARDCVWIGDFNSNTRWDRPTRVNNHSNVVAHLAQAQIVSAYHAHFQEAHGAETQNTFYLQRNLKKAYHIDYCFVPQTWLPRLKSFTVGSYDSWIKLSDHTPLFLELKD